MDDNVRHQVVAALLSIQSEYALDDALVFGSSIYAKRIAESDVDLICISGRTTTSQETVVVQGLLLDMYLCSLPELKKHLQTDIKTNNNYVLFGCATGHHLDLGSGQLADVIRLAKDLWNAGPAQMTPVDAFLLQKALLKLVITTGTIAKRHEPLSPWDGYANLKLSQMFLHAFYAYCRAHRLWASSLDVLLGWQGEEYADLQSACRHYVGTSEVHERCSMIIRLALDALMTLDEICGSEEHSFAWREKLDEVTPMMYTGRRL